MAGQGEWESVEVVAVVKVGCLMRTLLSPPQKGTGGGLAGVHLGRAAARQTLGSSLSLPPLRKLSLQTEGDWPPLPSPKSGDVRGEEGREG